MVLNQTAQAQGVQVGALVKTVGEWDAAGATMAEVVAKIKEHTQRPIRIGFLFRRKYSVCLSIGLVPLRSTVLFLISIPCFDVAVNANT